MKKVTVTSILWFDGIHWRPGWLGDSGFRNLETELFCRGVPKSTVTLPDSPQLFCHTESNNIKKVSFIGGGKLWSDSREKVIVISILWFEGKMLD